MSTDALTTTTTHDDGTFVRTALVIDSGEGTGGSVDLINANGELLARVNVFTDDRGDWLAVDVCDVGDRFTERRVLSFTDGRRQSLDAGSVGAVDFRREVK